ncbi:28S rRNA (cytosine-C(5))-methyltransferase-like [Babylonia areolata]|uniref:28S rRNA (cytosine-C(5))-methyltransferase-like n=1 Tax=Babylonia areolata TaxID=304850 RepID=UPI003FD17370
MDLYTEAAAVLDKFENKRGSVKSLVFASGYKNVRQLYALVCESLKYQPVLTTILKRSCSLQQEDSLQGQGHLATVLLYEHLVGKGLGRAGPIRTCILKHKKEIQEKCQELLEERGVTSLADLLSSQCQALNKLPIPRYVRVNLLKTTVEEAVAAFTEEGWAWQGPLGLESFRSQVEALGEEGFGSDPLLPDLLIFPPGTDLHDHPWVTGGCLLLQDRASCFPAHVLNPPEGATVLDCCAAPGNKTSHAASLMANSGKIWAYERDAKRMSLLQQQLRRTGVTNAKMVHQDFLSVDPRDERFADVEYVLVDPSCSGSGIMSRMDHVNATTTNNNTNNNNNSARLLSLQRFQISILKHALRFPAVRRLVYSTCSVHREENESVVAEVAQQVQGRFQVTAVFPQFPHRGGNGGEGEGEEEGEVVGRRCVRMSPEKDLTNGFFVACFERVSGGENEGKGENACGMDNRSGAALSKKKRKRKQTEQGENQDEGMLGSGATGDGSGAPSSKKKRKRKRAEEEGKKQDDTVLGSSGQSDVLHSAGQNGEPSVSPGLTPSSKKNRKRKREEVEEEESKKQDDTTVDSSGWSDVLFGAHQNREPDAEEAGSASPKKKKKKKNKCKSEKKEEKGDGVDLQSPRHGSSETPQSSTSPEVMASVGDALSVRKVKASKKGKENSTTNSEPIQDANLPVTPSDSFVCENAAAKKEKKKKKKKKKQLTDRPLVDSLRPPPLQIGQHDHHAATLPDPLTEESVVEEEKKKKKKKEKKRKKRASLTS